MKNNKCENFAYIKNKYFSFLNLQVIFFSKKYNTYMHIYIGKHIYLMFIYVSKNIIYIYINKYIYLMFIYV